MSFDRRLGQVFGFDEADLEANRAGRLSAEQARMFAAVASSGRRRSRVLLPLLAVLLLGTAVLAAATSGPDAAPALAVVGVMGSFMLLLVWFFARRSHHDQAVQAEGRVVKIEGPWSHDSTWDGDWTVRIGEFAFGVELLQEQALAEGATYRVHFLLTEPRPTLLSIERA
jgi:hypothetical protein